MKGEGFLKLLEASRSNLEYLMPSGISEKYRVLSAGKFKGNYKFRRSPYAREIVDTLSPECIYNVVGIEKGSQIGMTISAMANLILAVMRQYQEDILFMSDTDTQVKRAMDGFINDMIRESGLSALIGNSNNRTRKKTGTGDTAKEKKFGNNHTLYTWSGQTVGKLSSITPKYVFADEFERYVYSDKKGGSPYSLILARAKTYSGEYKVYFNSTPELKEMSSIHPVFLQGDRKYFKIPCPHCGAMINFEWFVDMGGKEKAGMHYKRDNFGTLIPKSVGYVCQECGGYFKEKHKYAMYEESESEIIKGGGMSWVNNKYLIKDTKQEPICRFEPTARALDPSYGSYHVSALYSGAGFYPWTEICKKWCLANPLDGPKNMDQLKTFYNQDLGLPWEDISKDVKGTKLLKHCRNYEPYIIPDELALSDGCGKIVALTLAVDLNGKMDDDNPSNDDVRLDWSVFAYTEKGNEDYINKYAIAHGSIGNFEREKEKRKREEKGDERAEKYTCRHGYKNNVWDILDKEVLMREWETQSGKKMKIMVCGIDTGTFTIHANQYVDKHSICIALKGEDMNKFTSNADKKVIRKGSKSKLWLVEGNRLKDRLYEALETEWDQATGIEQPTGYINYPQPTGDLFQYKTYFIEYEGEKREMEKDVLGRPKGIRWKKKSTEARQHFWDCHHYNDACVRIIEKEICDEFKVEVNWENFSTIIKNM